jgi:uncharacterized surface anchored protein
VNPLPDFTVEIVGPTGNPNAVSRTQGFTIHSGLNTIGGLEYGDYTINEASLPAGFEYVSISGSSFTVDANPENDIGITVTNNKLYGSIDVTKKFTGSVPADGTTFTFTLWEGDAQVGVAKTLTWSAAGDNKVSFTAPDYLLEYNHTYKVKEEAKTGFNIDPAYESGYEVRIDVEIPDRDIDCTNTKLGAITVTKAMLGDYVANPEFSFTIQGPSFEGAEPFTLTPGSNKPFTDLKNGQYTITEAVPDGYAPVGFTGGGGTGTLDRLSYQITVSEENLDIFVTCTNQQLGKLKLTKKDRENPGVYLGGAEFRVTSVDDPTVTFQLTTSSANDGTLGMVTSGWLVPGDYTVVETKAPAGYHIDDSTPRTMTVVAGQTAGGTAGTFVDSLGSVLVYMSSSYGDKLPVAGAVFELLRNNPSADGTLTAGDVVGTERRNEPMYLDTRP